MMLKGSYFKKHKYEIIFGLFCASLIMLVASQRLLDDDKSFNESKYTKILWNREMVEVMCGSSSEDLDFDENFAWLYAWLGSLDSRYGVVERTVLNDDCSVTLYCSSSQILNFYNKVKEKLSEAISEYEKVKGIKVKTSKGYDRISISCDKDYELSLDDNYLSIIKLYCLCLQSIETGGNDWNLVITTRNKDTLEILERVELPGNIGVYEHENENVTEGS